jgi:hypothetical protein
MTRMSASTAAPSAKHHAHRCPCPRCRRRRQMEIEALIEDVPSLGSDIRYAMTDRKLPGARAARRFGGYEAELQHEGKFQISQVEYINWVKRSLNRLYGAKLVSDAAGSTTGEYRTLVERFQKENGLKADGEVNKATQDALIKANESNRGYMVWVHRALESDPVFSDPPLTTPTSAGSFKSNGMRLGIRSFQNRRKRDLAVDGFVGAKTESRLIQACKCLPPGHYVSGLSPVTPPPEPVLYREKIRQEREKAKPLFMKRASEAISVLGQRPPTEPVKRTICILKKLRWSTTDSRYVTIHRARAYAFRASHGAPPPGSETESLLSEALDATRLTSSLDAFIERMIDLDQDVYHGKKEVEKQYQLGGYATKDVTARRMRDWISTQEKNQRSIYSCYV